ncbi:MAG: Fic family protein [Gammaproteobacteria bacterium]|nr:MAG: Fic family protein [Gammaproteobacteria bacterium]
MASPQEKLADSLEALKVLRKEGTVAIRSADLSRTHRERLVKAGFLQEVMKGWYIPSRPDDAKGESTAWVASYWAFCAAYLSARFGKDWSLSPEQSVLLHTGNWSVPKQLLVRSPKARNKVTALACDSSLLENRAALPGDDQTQTIDGLHVFALPAALVATGAGFFRRYPAEARTALAMVKDVSDVLSVLLTGGHSVVAGRLSGAFRNIGREKMAGEIIKTMRSADYDVREKDPFEEATALTFAPRAPSPHVTRMRLAWQAMRDSVMEAFPQAPGLPKNKNAYLKTVDEVYAEDAYHSLSIEGYRVSPELIEHVRGGAWNPDGNESDHGQRDAMAVRGYLEAFQAVKKTVEAVLGGKNPGVAADADHGTWYRELFSPSVRAGILSTADLAGYRNDQVYIRNARHVPPRHDAVRDLMPAFFELLREETDPAVRLVLGHFRPPVFRGSIPP